MLARFRKFIISNWHLLTIVILAIVISYQNYDSGTWLLGWDSLHPEFDFKLAYQRMFSGVWREDQGLGTLAIHSHMSDLPRVLVVHLLSFVLPDSMLRYSVLWIALILGPLGVGKLAGYIYGKRRGLRVVELLAALSYIFNLSTVLQLFVPFEMFTVLYGLIGWVFYFFSKYIAKGDKRDLNLLILTIIFISPSAYASTLWYAFFMGLVIYGSIYSLLTKKWSRSLQAILITILVNLYWILPSIYASFKSQDVFNSKINRLFSPEAWLINSSYGGYLDVARLRGFLLSWLTWYGERGEFDYLMKGWIEWLDKPVVYASLYGLSFLVVLGGLSVFLKNNYKKQGKKLLLSALGVYLVFYLFLLRQGVWGVMIERLSILFPYLRELLRTSYTKFSIQLSMVYSIFLALPVGLMLRKSKYLGYLMTGIVATILIVVGYPQIRGDLVSPVVRNEVPDEYFELFEHMSSQEYGRVALLPVPSPFGWEYYDWQKYGYDSYYQGAGFLQFGIKQPLLVRDYDRWSKYNESFYQQLSRSIYIEDYEMFENTLEKYDVSYLIIDRSMIDPGREGKSLKLDVIEEFINKAGGQLEFESGFIEAYLMDDSIDVIGASESISLVSEIEDYLRQDLVYSVGGDYLEKGGISYPFQYLSKESIEGVEYEELDGGYSLIKLVGDGHNKTIYLPSLDEGQEIYLPFTISYEKQKLELQIGSGIIIDGKDYFNVEDLEFDTDEELESIIIRIGGEFVEVVNGGSSDGYGKFSFGEEINVEVYDTSEIIQIDTQEIYENNEVYNCWEREGGDPLVDGGTDGELLRIKTRDAAGCLSFRLGDLEGGIIDLSLPHRSFDGARPNFCISRDGGAGCVSGDVYTEVSSSVEWHELNRKIAVDQGEYWIDITARPISIRGKESNIEYKAPIIKYYPQLDKYLVDSQIWGDSHEDSLDLDSDYLEVDILTKFTEIDFGLNGSQGEVSCDTLRRGEVNKYYYPDKTVKYVAKNRGSICDSIVLESVNENDEYLMRWVGENVFGRGLKFYLFSPTTLRSEIEYLLPSGKYDSTVGVLGRINGDLKYSLTAETRSFGGYSENIIEKVGIYPLPLEWLNMIVGGEREQMENGFDVRNVRKIGTFMYVVDGVNEGEGFVTLSQGFDEGWIAWVRGEPHEFLKHYRVSGWKNGWLIGEKDGELVDQGEIRLVILFWPQLLEYFGFGIMGITMVMLVWLSRRK